jgi:hypothetical protein
MNAGRGTENYQRADGGVDACAVAAIWWPKFITPVNWSVRLGGS